MRSNAGEFFLSISVNYVGVMITIISPSTDSILFTRFDNKVHFLELYYVFSYSKHILGSNLNFNA